MLFILVISLTYADWCNLGGSVTHSLAKSLRNFNPNCKHLNMFWTGPVNNCTGGGGAGTG